MARESDFLITLDTDKPIGDEAFARAFLSAWQNHPVECIRPERFGDGEPVREPIADVPFDELAARWTKRALMFTRRTKPRMTVSLGWRREKGLDPRPFPWDFVGWLARSAGAPAARALFELVVDHFEPAFADLTTQAESRRKHFIKRPHYVDGLHVGTAESFVGHHVMDTLPGVYWVTYFGPPAIARIGKARLLSIPCGRVEKRGQGYIVTLHDDPRDIGTEAAAASEQAIVNHLGAHLFFDRRTWTPPGGPAPGVWHH